jgi:predicted PP-loop superfamily ATPase
VAEVELKDEEIILAGVAFNLCGRCGALVESSRYKSHHKMHDDVMILQSQVSDLFKWNPGPWNNWKVNRGGRG